MDGRRRDYILRMAKLAAGEPEEFHDGDDLVERTRQYASSAVPRVTRKDVEEVLAKDGWPLPHSLKRGES